MTTHRLRTHEGMVLLRLAHTYPNLNLTIQEMVQNAIDAHAKHIHVLIDLSNGNNRRAVIQDDGEGITVQKFDEALRSVGQTVKPRAGTLGQFGLGLISPLDKVSSFNVTSQPGGGHEIRRWTFHRDRIAQMDQRVTIPSDRPSSLGAAETTWRGSVTWRTVVKLNGITKDRTTSLIDLEEMQAQIQTKFGQAMRTIKSVCRIVLIDETGRENSVLVEPNTYRGKPIEVVTYVQEDVGDVTFELYVANMHGGKRKGEVCIRKDGDAFSVPWKDFIRQARGGFSGTRWADTSPAFEVLGSGFFEGVITAKNIELDPQRTKFVVNDALLGLYLTLDQWYQEVGKLLHAEARNEHQSSRYQDLGLKCLERLNYLLDQPEFAHLRAAMENTFNVGRLGSGHVEPGRGTVNGPQDEPSVRTGQGGAGKPRTGGSTGGGDRTGIPDEERDPDRPGDKPTSVLGPRGQHRKLVKHDSIGLQLAYHPLDSLRLWELDLELGILYLNTTHRLWERCEKKDGHLLHLTSWVIMQVLHLLVRPKEQFDEAREFVDQQAKAYVEMFILNNPARPR